jgi:uncharacterized protein YbjT (DUF2867 family)
MILVTGATGTVGSHVLAMLRSRGEAVRGMSRGPGSDVRADFDDPASLARAVDGVDALFLVTVHPSAVPKHDLAMLDAAARAGVRKVVKLSAIGTGEKFGGGVVGAWLVPAEQAVRASGIPWTLLRPSFFASNALRPGPNLTGDGRQGVIDPRDVAAVAAEVLTSEGHSGQTYTLTGPELLSFPDLARILGRAVDDPPPDAAREQLVKSGMDSTVAGNIMVGASWVRAGHNAVLTDDVARILGRPPTSFETWARDHRGALTRSGTAT